MARMRQVIVDSYLPTPRTLIARHFPSRHVELLDLFPSITLLDISHSPDVFSMLDFRTLSLAKSLTHLDITGCSGMFDLQNLVVLSSLRRLRIRSAENPFSSPDTSSLVHDIGPLASLHRLSHVDISSCAEVRCLQPLSSLAGIAMLVVPHLAGLLEIRPPPPAWATSLEHLVACSAADVRSLGPVVASLTSLSSLCLYTCEDVVDIDALASLTRLTRLDLRMAYRLASLGPIAGLTRLTTLAISFAIGVRDLSPIGALLSLVALQVVACTDVTDVSPLAALSLLRSLDLQSSRALTDVLPLASLSFVTHLDMRECGCLSDASPLARLSGLSLLNMKGCRSLSAASVSALQRLTALDLCECAGGVMSRSLFPTRDRIPAAVHTHAEPPDMNDSVFDRSGRPKRHRDSM